MLLENKVAVIYGAGGPMGGAVARAFAREEARVFLAGRTKAKLDTVATLVPGANYFLGLEKFPPARKLIDAGVAVALATDYNPGSSPTASMPFVLSLACTHLKMSPSEAIAAATINGAWSLRLQERKGSIEPGKDADLAVFDVADYRETAYWVASNRCAFAILSGTVATSRPD